MTQLLVSVRNAVEAKAALAGGAHLIDVKEPSRGSLGRADDATIAEVVRVVAGRRQVSAALGEWVDYVQLPACASQVQFLKWGLSKFRLDAAAAWRVFHSQVHLVHAFNPACEVVMVAYADARQAQAPEVEEVYEHLLGIGQRVLLLDTFEKDGLTLLDYLDLKTLERLVTRCRQDGFRVALAGSLGFNEIVTLNYLQPDWFAVRGAVCQGRQRTAAIDAGRVRQLVEMIEEAS